MTELLTSQNDTFLHQPTRSGFEIVDLAARRYQTSFSDPDIGLAAAQAGCFEVGPDLAGAIPDNRMDRQPICFCQSNCFSRLHFWSKTGQHNCDHSEEREYRERDKRFHHSGLLWLLAAPFALGECCYNNQNEILFIICNLYLRPPLLDGLLGPVVA